MKRLILTGLCMILLLTACSKNDFSNDYSTGSGFEEVIKCEVNEVSVNNECLKVRSPTKINGGVVTVNGRLIINGVDTLKKEFSSKCCYPDSKSFSDCDCVYGEKNILINVFKVGK